MSEIKLLPCPFCGNNDRRVGIRRMGKKGYKVVCGKCGASGSYVAIKDWHDNKMIAQGQAIKLWNTRKPMERIVERLEEVSNEKTEIWSGIGRTDDSRCYGFYVLGIDESIEIVKEEGGIE